MRKIHYLLIIKTTVMKRIALAAGLAALIVVAFGSMKIANNKQKEVKKTEKKCSYTRSSCLGK